MNAERRQPGDVATLARLARDVGNEALPPVHLWDPPHCGDSLMRIAADGTWSHEGTPIRRPALVRLFSTILRRDGDEHVLVTPVEKLTIAVEDAPFVAVALEADGDGEGQRLRFVTNVGDTVAAGPTHPLRFEQGAADGLKPYVRVRGDLWARLARPLLYELAELAVEDRAGRTGVFTGGAFFPMGDETAGKA